MQIAVNENSRPPYVVFQERSVEDRKATMEQGRYVARPQDWAIVRQAGSKDASEIEVNDWLDRISKNPGFPKEWVTAFKDAYAQWKKGHEPVPNGTHIRQWPQISPAQAEMITACGVLTVEDLAAANEPTLQRLGMGSRDLKSKAQAWLDSASKIGSVAEELASLRALVMEFKEQNNELRANLLAERAKNGTSPVELAPVPKATETDPFA